MGLNVPSPNLPRFSVVLVNYKTYELTKMCLNLLQQGLKHYDAEVWVVDNDSADQSTDYLRGLEWINLIERKPIQKEQGFVAHGEALDLVLERVETEFVFLMHTDTLIHDPEIFEIMLKNCCKKRDIYAVGCLEQIDRGFFRSYWRFATRFLSHQTRRLKLGLGFKSREPKPYKEVYLKSFFALWNVKKLKENKLKFLMENRIPGYEAQDRLASLGLDRVVMPTREIFGYLDHVEAGTVAANGGYHQGHRRLRNYRAILDGMAQNKN